MTYYETDIFLDDKMNTLSFRHWLYHGYAELNRLYNIGKEKKNTRKYIKEIFHDERRWKRKNKMLNRVNGGNRKKIKCETGIWLINKPKSKYQRSWNDWT